MLLSDGKINETVLKRSVLKQIDNKRNVLWGPGPGRDSAIINTGDGELLLSSIAPVTYTDSKGAYTAINKAVNNVAALGGRTRAVMVSFFLPEGFTEEELKSYMKELSLVAGELDAEIAGGHTEVTGVVNQPVVTVCAIGSIERDRAESFKYAKAGDDLVISKWIGLEGTSLIAGRKEDKLKQIFAASFVDEAKDFDQYISITKEADIAVAAGVHAMHDLSVGGVFAGLWEIAERSNLGLTADLLKIPLKQHTVEICEQFDLNPYELMSGGSLLMAAADGNALTAALKTAGINAAVIGKFTDSNDRVLINKDEKRFIDISKSDEIYKLI